MDSLQTIQARAVGMDPYELKAEFAGQITLHGAVDVQGWLQETTPAEIEREINRLIDEVGDGGGFIISPSHHIQPDTPLENVLAFYGTVARRRGTSLE
jgi:uroporphyrinogen decarboxylase